MKVKIRRKLSKSFGIPIIGENAPTDEKNEELKVEESEVEELEPENEESATTLEQKVESSVTKIKISL